MLLQLFFSISICRQYLFPSITFSLCVSFDLKQVFYRQHICGSCFFMYSSTLCLLIGAFSPFTFKVIIHRYVVIAILLLSDCFVVLLCSFLILLFPSLLCWWLSMLCFSSYLFIVHVSLIDFWFEVIMCFIYTKLCLYQSILSWWLLMLEHILKSLHFLLIPFMFMFLSLFLLLLGVCVFVCIP